jgi:RNA polymerase sigma factor (sigma-70 family)
LVLKAAAPPDESDAELLGRFVRDRDHAAFGELVRRHGPMVWGVCRDALGAGPDAEDAFQATFLVLVQKGGTVSPRGLVGNWLYGVAWRTARHARRRRATLRARRRALPDVPDPHPPRTASAEAADTVRAELARLPDRYRAAVVLCELEGRTIAEAARVLGVAVGTVASRLARGREMLAARLRRRGLAPTVAGLTAALAQLASGGVPNGLTSKAVAWAHAPGLLPAAVAALTHRVLRAMLIHKFERLTLALVVATGVLAAALVAAERWLADPLTPARASAAAPVPPPPKRVPSGPNKLLFYRAGNLVLIDPDGRNENQLTRERLIYWDARLSPDGKTMALMVESRVDPFGAVLCARALDGKQPDVNLGEVEGALFVWSPDGTQIACTAYASEKMRGIPTGPPSMARHFVVDVKTGEQKPLTLPDGHYLSDWSPDGKFFLTTRFVADEKKPRSRLCLMNRDGTQHKVLTDDTQLSAGGRFSPDGARVLYRVRPAPKNGGAPEPELAVLDLATGTSIVVGELPHADEFVGCCWSPDGKRIAYAWRGHPEQKGIVIGQKGAVVEQTAWHLVVCDPDGKNAKTLATEELLWRRQMGIGQVDWR